MAEVSEPVLTSWLEFVALVHLSFLLFLSVSLFSTLHSRAVPGTNNLRIIYFTISLITLEGEVYIYFSCECSVFLLLGAINTVVLRHRSLPARAPCQRCCTASQAGCKAHPKKSNRADACAFSTGAWQVVWGYFTLLSLPLRKGSLCSCLLMPYTFGELFWTTIWNPHCRVKWNNKPSAKSPGKRTTHDAHFTCNLMCFTVAALMHPGHPAPSAPCLSWSQIYHARTISVKLICLLKTYPPPPPF